MIIYFVRHASAGEHVSNPKKDEKRPLDADGIEQCGYVGRALAALNAQPDVVISSPLKRATQTASLIGNELGFEGKLQLEPALRPEASFADFRRMLDKYSKHEAIMVVGHNPSITDFLARMIAKSGCEARVDFKKGAVARAEIDRRAATLNWFLTPKIAREIQTAAAADAEKSRPSTPRK
jgi:phosphohistidine phosphatase